MFRGKSRRAFTKTVLWWTNRGRLSFQEVSKRQVQATVFRQETQGLELAPQDESFYRPGDALVVIRRSDCCGSSLYREWRIPHRRA